MPKVSLDATNSVDVLKGAEFTNQKLKDYFLASIQQQIKLDIDEVGARVENRAIILMKKTTVRSSSKPIPKIFHLDEPFYVVMKELKKNPYLVAYIKEVKSI